MADIITERKGALAGQLGIEELRTIKKPFTRTGKGKDDKTVKTTHYIGTPFTYLTHGNQPSIGTDYASICIIGCPKDYNLGKHWPAKTASSYSD